ncbi:hypothetical protein TSUD_390170 [Trifolium subterraneum]|uniref:WAT1-related protein n=1 Tax=Trifolium subterraneum TaxID=3900 RepID=A0A2Z6NF76_TRISU|nr:hypothetical protein TSUD_390170 [Trifolium subterraneum]
MKGVWNRMHGLKPVMLMVLVQIAYAAVNVLYKLAINDGMTVKVATAYRLAFGSAFTVPLALISERGSLFQNLFYEALALTSATFASAIYNLIPAITFIMAISCGFEKLNLRAASGKAKVLGTVIGIGGAMMLIFLKGVEINIWPFHINLLHPAQHQNSHVASQNGIVASGLVVIVTSWCIKMRGPLFASVFNPLMLLFVTIVASMTLDENLYLGSLIGAVLIVCGLYMVLWGKSKEMKKIAQLATSKIAQETEDIEVVVMPTLEVVDHDKSHVNNNHTEVDKDRVDYLSKNREISSSISDDQEIEKCSTN